MDDNSLVFSVSDFVAVFNQTLEYAYPSVTIVGELANFRVSKNRWVYFDLKDEESSVKFFGTVYNLPGPLEDGLRLEVKGSPRLHSLFGFSINVINMKPVGEGSIKKAASLLESKLRHEGLFDPERKRSLPYPPKTIGLITSSESAAYHDFIKIINERWVGIDIRLYDVLVQGEQATEQVVQAINYFSQHADAPEVIVMTRGGGSADDLAVFSGEQVTRAVAGSRVPTLVAIGHEVDVSLAELAADRRASTPSNAAELLTPDKNASTRQLVQMSMQLSNLITAVVGRAEDSLSTTVTSYQAAINQLILKYETDLGQSHSLLVALSPRAVLGRGYAIVRQSGSVIKSGKHLKVHDELSIELKDSNITVITKEVKVK